MTFQTREDSLIISVIITAFNRKRFLRDAILSALNQTLPKSQYEILVIRNFRDKAIDDLIEKAGAISIVEGDKTIGEYLSIAVERCVGDVLAFLDDDDQFSTDKLEHLYSWFDRDPEAGYFHNDVSYIDEHGLQMTVHGFRKRWTNRMQKIGGFSVEEPLDIDDANKLVKTGAYFNLSSIAIRKKIALERIDYLRLIEMSPDPFMFFSSLLSRCRCRIDPRALTSRRVHDMNLSVFTHQPKAGITARQLDFLAKDARCFEIMLRMQNNSGLSKNARKILLYELWQRRMLLSMLAAGSSKSKILAESFKGSKYLFSATILPWLKVVAGSVIYSLSAKLGRVLFQRVTTK